MKRFIVLAIAALFAVSFTAPSMAEAKTELQIRNENKAKEYKARKAAERSVKEAKKASKSSKRR